MNYQFFLLYVLLSFSVIAQDKSDLQESGTPLVQVLSKVEEFYSIKFSYNTDIISQYRVHSIQWQSLEDDLRQIQRQTSIFFEKINEHYYAIRSKKNTNKSFKICGYVINSINKKPISSCKVQNTKGSLFTNTDSKGYFELFLSDTTDNIFIYHPEFQMKLMQTTMFKSGICKTIGLKEDSYQLEEVLISDYLKNNILENSSKDEVRIDPNNIGVLPSLVEPDILEILQILPGVQSPDETASDIFIRGGSPDQNLVLWDGIRMYSSGHFFGAFSTYNPYVTEDIKLIRGGTSPQYGGAISGVIDIRSTDRIPEQLQGGGGVNFTHGDLFLKIPVAKNLGFILSGRRSYVDFIQTGTYNNYLSRSLQNAMFFQDQEFFVDNDIKMTSTDFYFADVTGKLIWEATKNDKLAISFIHNENETSYTFKTLEVPEITSYTSLDQINKLGNRNTGTSIIWNHIWTPKFSFTVNGNLSLFDNRFRSTENFYDQEPFDVEGLVFEDDYINTNTVKEIKASTVFDWKIHDALGLKSGFEISEVRTKIDSKSQSEFIPFAELIENDSLLIDLSNTTRAVFSDFQFTSTKKLSANLGVRLTDFSIFQNPKLNNVYVEPRLRLQLRMNDQLQARLSYDQKYQVVSGRSFLEGRSFGILRKEWLSVDDDYGEPPMSDQWSIGFIYRKKTVAIDLDFYRKKVTNLSSFTRGFEQVPVFDIGHNTNVGIDVLIKKRFRTYQTWISYSLSKQQSSFEGLNNGDPFPGNYDSRHRFSWSHQLRLNNLEFSLGWNYRTGTPYSKNVTLFFGTNRYLDFGPINNGRLDDYHRLDFTGSYKFEFDKKSKLKGRIALSLLNIYNRKNNLGKLFDPKLIRTDPNTSEPIFELDSRERKSLGFTPNISFRIRF